VVNSYHTKFSTNFLLETSQLRSLYVRNFLRLRDPDIKMSMGRKSAARAREETIDK
jgi:hypothetical protein